MEANAPNIWLGYGPGGTVTASPEPTPPELPGFRWVPGAICDHVRLGRMNICESATVSLLCLTADHGGYRGEITPLLLSRRFKDLTTRQAKLVLGSLQTKGYITYDPKTKEYEVQIAYIQADLPVEISEELPNDDDLEPNA